MQGFEKTNRTICHDKESKKSSEEYSCCLSFEWYADISQDINQAGKQNKAGNNRSQLHKHKFIWTVSLTVSGVFCNVSFDAEMLRENTIYHGLICLAGLIIL